MSLESRISPINAHTQQMAHVPSLENWEWGLKIFDGAPTPNTHVGHPLHTHITNKQKTNLTWLYNSHVHVATTPKMPRNIKWWHYARCSTYAENYARLIGTALGSVCVQLSALHPLSLSFFSISPPVLKLLSFLILLLSPSSLLPLCLCCHLHRFFFDPLTLSFPLPSLPPHPSGDLSMTDAPDQPALTEDFDRHLSMVSGRGKGEGGGEGEGGGREGEGEGEGEG